MKMALVIELVTVTEDSLSDGRNKAPIAALPKQLSALLVVNYANLLTVFDMLTISPHVVLASFY